MLRRLAQIDLNLLVVFQAVDEQRHITNAARALGASQSAVSHALARLRRLLGDELFVKTPGGMEPTPRAQRLAPKVRALVHDLEGALLGEKPFSPKTLDRTFRIRTTDLIECLLLPDLIQRLAQEAPRVKVVCETARFELPRDDLERGRVDLAVAGFFGELPSGYFRQKLFDDAFLCCARKGRKMALDEFCARRHVLIAPSGELSGRIDALLAKKGKSRTVVAGTAGFLAAGFVAAGSDCVLTAPSRLVDRLTTVLPLRAFPPPLEVPGITVHQVWHERNDGDPEHQWLRGLIRAALQR